jgi:chromosome segregation ATPase
MSIDLRRFDYALDPLLRMRQWQLEALRTQLGRLQKRIAALQQELDRAHGELHAQGALAAKFLLQRCDPERHVRSLHWLQQQRTRIAALDRQMAGLHAERSQLMTRCQAQQQGIDAIEAHRDEAVADFARAEAAGLATVADRDWLARLAVDNARKETSAAGGAA